MGVGLGGSFTGDVYVSNAANINDLAGPFVNNTVGAGDGVDGAAGSFYGSSPDGTVIGVGASAGAGLGASGSVTVTSTTIVPLLPFRGGGACGCGSK